jgi:hypothetical protein
VHASLDAVAARAGSLSRVAISNAMGGVFPHDGETRLRAFRESRLRAWCVGEVSIANGQTVIHKSTDQTLWKCKDCGGTVWLKTGIDPNVKLLDGVQKESHGKR